MPIYVYGCKDKTHPRIEVHHGYYDNPILECEKCGSRLFRIPQKMLWGINPLSIVKEWSERNWSKKLRKEPREQSYNSLATDRGKPQRDFNARK